MNKRIKELALQAGMVKFPPSIETELQKNILFGDGQIEKFAKAIVLEAVKEAEDDCAGWTDRDQCLVGQVMDRIKKHFGVEE
jgi:hypothetical protein